MYRVSQNLKKLGHHVGKIDLSKLMLFFDTESKYVTFMVIGLKGYKLQMQTKNKPVGDLSFSAAKAAQEMLMSVCLSVSLSVCLSVCGQTSTIVTNSRALIMMVRASSIPVKQINQSTNIKHLSIESFRSPRHLAVLVLFKHPSNMITYLPLFKTLSKLFNQFSTMYFIWHKERVGVQCEWRGWSVLHLLFGSSIDQLSFVKQCVW